MKNWSIHVVHNQSILLHSQAVLINTMSLLQNPLVDQCAKPVAISTKDCRFHN